jgi:hypothetical protein
MPFAAVFPASDRLHEHNAHEYPRRCDGVVSTEPSRYCSYRSLIPRNSPSGINTFGPPRTTGTGHGASWSSRHLQRANRIRAD